MPKFIPFSIYFDLFLDVEGCKACHFIPVSKNPEHDINFCKIYFFLLCGKDYNSIPFLKCKCTCMYTIQSIFFFFFVRSLCFFGVLLCQCVGKQQFVLVLMRCGMLKTSVGISSGKYSRGIEVCCVIG